MSPYEEESSLYDDKSWCRLRNFGDNETISALTGIKSELAQAIVSKKQRGSQAKILFRL